MSIHATPGYKMVVSPNLSVDISLLNPSQLLIVIVVIDQFTDRLGNSHCSFVYFHHLSLVAIDESLLASPAK